ncbi:MAG TPA: type 1 glutamine amidotransferase [Pelomicrobium sp.]|nr:type 1 glutamine amidotransferase [Pelomicrobium sp.]
MKPVAIFRHFRTEGPGYFATYLDARSVPWELIPLDAGASVPPDTGAHAGFVFMGGPMSVNDDLPWIAPALRLIRDAVARDLPVLGHCLGGQLIAKALGAEVTRASYKEIGWGEVRLADEPRAREWFPGLPTAFDSFHWHGETFAIPPGATRLLSSRWCENQAFALGNTLGLQCHIEMTETLVREWCAGGAKEIAASSSPGVQPPEVIQADLEEKVAALHRVADAAYSRWTAALRG